MVCHIHFKHNHTLPMKELENSFSNVNFIHYVKIDFSNANWFSIQDCSISHYFTHMWVVIISNLKKLKLSTGLGTFQGAVAPAKCVVAPEKMYCSTRKLKLTDNELVTWVPCSTKYTLVWQCYRMPSPGNCQN